MSNEEILQNIADAVVQGKKDACIAGTQEALAAGIVPYDILMDGAKKGMDVVGELYASKQIFLPQVLTSADAMYQAIDVLRPMMGGQENIKSPGTIAIGVAEGDVHDIGKNIVRMLLDGSGYNVIDLGRDVQLEDFIDAVKENIVDVVACSTLMTTTLASIEDLMNALREESLADKVGTIIGGAATNQDFADECGADAWGKDAAAGLEKIGRLVREGGGT